VNARHAIAKYSLIEFVEVKEYSPTDAVSFEDLFFDEVLDASNGELEMHGGFFLSEPFGWVCNHWVDIFVDAKLARFGGRMVKKVCNFYATRNELNRSMRLGYNQDIPCVSKEEKLPRM
jgi:hypothetical protein